LISSCLSWFLCSFFYRSLFVLLSFFFSPLCCLSFFDVRIMTTLFLLLTYMQDTPTLYQVGLKQFCAKYTSPRWKWDVNCTHFYE
jgi:hypothetical protein